MGMHVVVIDREDADDYEVYGPFKTGDDARTWILQHPALTRKATYSVIPLRAQADVL